MTSSLAKRSWSAGFLSALVVMLTLAYAQPAAAFFGYVDGIDSSWVVTGWVCTNSSCNESHTIMIQVVDHSYFSGGGSHIAATCYANGTRGDWVTGHGFNSCQVDANYRSGTDYWVRVAYVQNGCIIPAAYCEPNGWENVAAQGDAVSFIQHGGSPIDYSPAVHVSAPSGTGTISNGGVTISTSDALAGTINSLIWNYRQFVYNHESGASMQSAAQFGAASPETGECFNPTEAGSWNTWAPRSTSLLIATDPADLSNATTALTTQSRMAFWLPHGWEHPEVSCSSGYHNDETIDANSAFRLWKHVAIAGSGLITYDTAFLAVPEIISGFNQFEATTGYLPANADPFTKFFDAAHSNYTAAFDFDTDHSSNGPIILATTSEDFAIGIKSAPAASGPAASFYTGNTGYGVIAKPGDGTVKWSMVYQCDSAAGDSCTANAVDYYFTTTIVVGTLPNVRSTVQGW